MVKESPNSCDGCGKKLHHWSISIESGEKEYCEKCYHQLKKPPEQKNTQPKNILEEEYKKEGNNQNMGVLGIIVGIAMMIISPYFTFPIITFIVAIIIVLVSALKINSSTTRQSDLKIKLSENNKSLNNESPLNILKRRYASGEISKSQFEKMKKELK